MADNQSNIQIRSEEIQEILTAIPNWTIRWGNTLIFVLFLLLIVISWFVKYPDIITTEALVTTQIPPQKIYSKSNGKITHLLVQDGEIVNANTTIAVIENTANYQDVFLLQSIVDTIIINKKEFRFPIADLPVLFLGGIETDYALFENDYLQYQLNKNHQPYLYESDANSSALLQMKNRMTSLLSQKKLYDVELDLKRKDSERQNDLFEKGIISARDFELSKQNYLAAERAFQNISLSISQLEQSITEGYKVTKGTQYNKTKEELQLLKKVIQSFNRLKEAIRRWENTYVLKTAIKGKLTYLNIWNTNQYIESGKLIFTVIPNEEKNYIARLKAPTQNSGKIKKGQQVQIKLANYPNDEFGVLNGTISSISLTPNNEGLYIINVVLPNEMKTSYGKTIDFKQEMRGSADIITEDLRLIERFFYQLRKVFVK